MYFNWKLSKELPEKEGNGVRELVLRMDQSLRSNGLPIEGFEFIHSTKKMLEITREIEDEIKKSPRDVTLYVGFQNIDKLDKEINRYKELRSMGIKINAFGMNEASEIYSGAIDNWTKINESPENVENQWFLVVENPSPIAFVGWEISDELFAKGKLSDPGKKFQGFASSDIRVVRSLMQYLDSVRLGNSEGPDTAKEIAQNIGRDVERIIIVTQDKSANEATEISESLMRDAIDICVELNAEAMLYDISAASYFVKPGPPGSGELTKMALDENTVRNIGRVHLANQMQRFTNKGVKCKALLAPQHGLQTLMDVASKESAEIVIVPRYYEYPRLLDRIVGNSLSQIENPYSSNLIVHEENLGFRSSYIDQKPLVA